MNAISLFPFFQSFTAGFRTFTQKCIRVTIFHHFIEGVQDVKVVGVPHDFFGEVPCACIVMKPGVCFDEAKMREYLARVLTKQKLPEYFYLFKEFPMLASGKTDSVRIKKLAVEKFGANLCG